MREIKFRSWTAWNKKMRYDIHKISFAPPETPLNGKAILVEFEEPNYAQGLGTDLTLMQYTGLKDKNGKEIYEGDVLKNYANVNGEVIFVDGAFMFSWDEQEEVLTLYEIKMQRLEIIGNIYENPELINKRGV